MKASRRRPAAAPPRRSATPPKGAKRSLLSALPLPLKAARPFPRGAKPRPSLNLHTTMQSVVEVLLRGGAPPFGAPPRSRAGARKPPTRKAIDSLAQLYRQVDRLPATMRLENAIACARRSQRREVLHAIGKSGGGAGARKGGQKPKLKPRC